MPTPTEIANLALSHLGTGKEIQNLETEKSNEANACRRYYELARDTTLRDFPWSFANKTATLPLVEEDPTDEWAFSYRYPTDCTHMRKILSSQRNDTRQTRVPFEIASDDQGKLIYTDEADAQVKYTAKVTDSERFTPDFTLAFSFRLAAYIAPRITGADPFRMGERAVRLYLFEIRKAEAADVNEQQDEEEPEAEQIRARD